MKSSIRKSVTAWFRRMFGGDDSSDWAFGAVFGIFACIMFTHAYSLFGALLGGIIAFGVIVTGLRLASRAPRLGVVLAVIFITVMIFNHVALFHLVK